MKTKRPIGLSPTQRVLLQQLQDGARLLFVQSGSSAGGNAGTIDDHYVVSLGRPGEDLRRCTKAAQALIAKGYVWNHKPKFSSRDDFRLTPLGTAWKP